MPRTLRPNTPGDHRIKLRPETIWSFNVLFEDFMAYHGFAVEAAHAEPVAVSA